MLQTKTLRTTIPMALAVLALLTYNFIGAEWNAAPANPPNNNTPAPINVGSVAQSKNGTLVLNGSAGSLFSSSSIASENIVLAMNEMRSPKYCDLNGENCLDNSSDDSVYNITTQIFDLSANSDGRTQYLGAWSFCSMGQMYINPESGNENNDDANCEVTQAETPGYWKLYAKLSDAGSQSVTCQANCFYLGDNRPEGTGEIPHTYNWVIGNWVTTSTSCSSGGTLTIHQARSVKCVNESGAQVSDSLCSGHPSRTGIDYGTCPSRS